MNWLWSLAHFFGARNNDANSAGYLFWSGVGSDLTYLGIAYAVVRKMNCHVDHCWRIGRHHTAAGHVVCRKHHPDDRLTAGDVAAAHEQSIMESVKGRDTA